MISLLNGLFFDEYLFIICDIFFICFILILLCLAIFFNNIVKSLYISRLIIDLTIPIVIFSFFLSFNFNNIGVLLNFSSILFDSMYFFFKSYFFFFFIILFNFFKKLFYI